jgi:hypothetical protein
LLLEDIAVLLTIRLILLVVNRAVINIKYEAFPVCSSQELLLKGAFGYFGFRESSKFFYFYLIVEMHNYVRIQILMQRR